MYAMSSGNESSAEPMSMNMLEYIRDRSQYHPSINKKEGRYKIYYCFKQSRAEWKEVLL